MVSHDDQFRKAMERIWECNWLYEHFDVPAPKDTVDASHALKAMVDDGTSLFLPMLFEITDLRDRVAALEDRVKSDQ